MTEIHTHAHKINILHVIHEAQRDDWIDLKAPLRLVSDLITRMSGIDMFTTLLNRAIQ